MTSLFESSLARPGPIFIGGIGGSGTRAVAGILRDIGLPIGARLNDELDALPFDDVCERFTTPVLEQARSPNYPLEMIDPALRLRTLQALELAAAAHVADSGDAAVWIAKSPRLLHLLPFLSVAFPGMRFVHVVRDGRDMAHSANQNQTRKHFRAMFREPPPADQSAGSIRFWSHANIHAATFGQLTMGADYQVLSHEALCADPENTIQTLLTRLGFAINDRTLARVAESIKPSSTLGRWRGLSRSRKAALEDIGRRGLSFFGYPPRAPSACSPPGPRPVAGKTAVLVTGCHRSGTSLAASVLARLGLDVGLSEMPPTDANPAGYWENTALVALNDRLFGILGQDWASTAVLPARWQDSSVAAEFGALLQRTLAREMDPDRGWCIKDPRLCRVLEPWLDALDRLGRTVKVVLVVRHPLEVAASLTRRDGLSLRHGLRLWAMDLQRAERGSRAVARTFVHYDAFLEAPGDTCAAIARFIDDGLDPGATADAGQSIDRTLRHQGIEARAEPLDPALRAMVDRAWAAATTLSAEADDGARHELDAALSALLVDTDDVWLDQAQADRTQREARVASERLRTERALGNARAIAAAGDAERGLEDLLVRPLPETEGTSKYPRWVETMEPLRYGQSRASGPQSTDTRSFSAAAVLLPHSAALPPEPPFKNPQTLFTDTAATLVATAGTLAAWSWRRHFEPSQALARFPHSDWLKRLLAENAAAWFIFIEPDTRLADDFLDIVATTHARHPASTVLHSDYDYEVPGGDRENPVLKPPTWDDDLHLQRHVMRGWFAVHRDVLATCPDPTGGTALEVSYELRVHPETLCRIIPTALIIDLKSPNLSFRWT